MHTTFTHFKLIPFTLMLIGALLGSLAGCSNEACDDETCNTPEVMNCNGPEGCPIGQVCDPATALCIDRVTFCTPVSDQACQDDPSCTICPNGQLCDVSTGYCVSGDACMFTSCPLDRQCNPDTDQCEVIDCASDGEVCPEGTVCGQDGACVIGCIAASDCRDNQRCALDGAQDSVTIGICTTLCQSDEACPWGEACVQMAEQGQCEPEGPCESQTDCRSGESCRGGTCLRRLCSEDEACSEGEYCQQDTGLCLEDTCIADNFEPNNSQDEAKRLLQGTYLNVTLCRDDREDWYSVRLVGEQDVTIELLHDPSIADLDLEVYQGGRLLGASGTPSIREAVTLGPAVRGVIDVRVHAASGSDAPYLLTVGADAPACIDDDTEPNNSTSSAVTLTTDEEPPEIITCGGDLDIFRIIPSNPRGESLSIQFTPETADTALEGWRTAISLDEVTWIPLSELQPFDRRGVRFAYIGPEQRIFLLSEATEPLSWTMGLNPTEPSCLDEEQDNHTPDTALDVGLELGATIQRQGRALCLSDRETPNLEADWYKLDLPDGDIEIEVVLSEFAEDFAGDPAPKLAQATLLTGETPLPWRTSSPGDETRRSEASNAVLVATISRVDRPVWLKVDSQKELPKVLKEWPAYDLAMTVQTAAAPCVQDRTEGIGNDTPETATFVEEANLRAVLCPGDTDLLQIPLAQWLSSEQESALRISSIEAPVRYSIRLSPDAAPLLEGVIEPGDIDDENYSNVTALSALPASAEHIWLEVQPTSATPPSGLTYNIAIVPTEMDNSGN